MTGLDFCSGEVSPPVHHDLRLRWFGLIRVILLIRLFARIERVLDLGVLNLIHYRRFGVIVLYRPEDILQMCWVTPHRAPSKVSHRLPAYFPSPVVKSRCAVL